MSAYVVIVIKDTNGTIAQLNAQLQNDSVSDPNTIINKVANYVTANASGCNAAGTVQVVTRSTDPSVSTAGSGSQTVTLNVG